MWEGTNGKDSFGRRYGLGSCLKALSDGREGALISRSRAPLLWELLLEWGEMGPDHGLGRALEQESGPGSLAVRWPHGLTLPSVSPVQGLYERLAEVEPG